MDLFDPILYDKEKVMKNIRLEVLRKDWISGLLEVIVHRDIEGTDLAFIPFIETEQTVMYFFAPMVMILKATPDELIDRALQNMREEKWTVNYNLHGLCYVSPSADAFIPEKLSECCGDDEGIYILPFTRKGAELMKESVMEKEEVVQAFKESAEDLRELGVLTQENQLDDKVYLFKNGRYRIL